MPSEVQPPSGGLPRNGRGGRRRSRGHSPFCPQRPAGPFFRPGRRSPPKCPGGNGQHTGFLWPPGAHPGRFPALRRRGHASCPVFPRPAGGRRCLPFCPERPVERFFSPGRLPRKGPGPSGPHRGFLCPFGAHPGRFPPLRRRGHASCPVFLPVRRGQAALAILSSEPRRAVFLSPALPRKGPGPSGPHRGFLWPSGACPGGFPALRRRGHAACPVFLPSAGGRRLLPFCPERPAERFFPLLRSQGSVLGRQACTGASCGPLGHVPGVSRPRLRPLSQFFRPFPLSPFFRPFPLPKFFLHPLYMSPRPRVRERERDVDLYR